jgi:hypothetical protein
LGETTGEARCFSQFSGSVIDRNASYHPSI